MDEDQLDKVVEYIRANIRSITTFNDTKITFVLNHCKMDEMGYDPNSITISMDLDFAEIPIGVDEKSDEPQYGLSSKNAREKPQRSQSRPASVRESAKRRRGSGGKSGKSPRKLALKPSKSDKSNSVPPKSSRKSKSKSPKHSSKSRKGSRTGNLNAPSRKGHGKQYSLDDMNIGSLSVRKAKKESKWEQLSTKRLMTKHGLNPDEANCRYKLAQQVEFSAKLKREEKINWSTPMKGQKIYAFAVENCNEEDTANELRNVKGGVGKKSVSMTVKAEMHHGAHVRLHVWYK